MNSAEPNASEEYYRRLVEHADDVIYRTDRFGRFTFMNLAALRLLGREAADMIGMSYLDVVAPAAHREVTDFYMRQLRERTPSTYLEFPALLPDGEIIWLGQNVRLLYDGDRYVGFQAIVRDVTERRRTEEALRLRDRAIAAATSGIVISDPRLPGNPLIYVNPAFEHITGYTASEVLGRNCRFLQGADTDPLVVDDLRASLRAGRASEHVLKNYRKDGTPFWNQLTISPVHNEDGQLINFIGVQQDITARKAAEEAARASEEYRQLFRLANDPILILDPHGEIVLDVNDKACEVYGLRREEFVGRCLKDMSRDPARGEGKLNEVIARQIGHEFESVQYRADGTPIYFLINSSMIEFQGRPAVLSINRDVTARRAASAALRESEVKYRTLVESINEGIIQVDNELSIQFVNDRFCKMTGYRREELIGRAAPAILFDEEGRETMRRTRERRLRGLSDSYETKMRKKSGETLWALVGGTPIVDAAGAVVGSMGVHTDITERKRVEQQLQHNAFHDLLTGLPNRALFLDHVRHAIKRAGHQSARAGESAARDFAVMFLDFDRFKIVNDSLGHAEGDNLLILIARRLEASLRPGDVVARIGGDEFTILVDDLRDPSDALRVAERINADMKEPFDLGGREVFSSVSIGIAFGGAAYQAPEDLLRDADIAMYRAKSGGKARYEVFDQAMHRQAAARLQLEIELRRAFEREEFCLYYQPIVELGGERLTGFEALVRWRHPERGIVPPGEFIPVAEETGIIVQLGEWVLGEACRQLRAWQERTAGGAALTVSVNLSCKQFMQTDFAERVADVLRETKLGAKYLRLEITESHVMEDSRLAATMLNRLRSLGVEISIDDFGTGYSSLSYLHRLPVSYLKIDRSFVTNMQTSAENGEIVRTIIALAKNLDMHTVAEGVEETDQLSMLRELGCEYGQGYLFAKPMSAADAEALVTAAAAAATASREFPPTAGDDFPVNAKFIN